MRQYSNVFEVFDRISGGATVAKVPDIRMHTSDTCGYMDPVLYDGATVCGC